MRLLLASCVALCLGCVSNPYALVNFARGETLKTTPGSWFISVESGLVDSVQGTPRARFQQQLVYGGISGSVIRVWYREYAENYARPAFSQELQYDLSVSRVIIFRRLRLEVLSATNQEIEVRVLDDDGLASRAARMRPPRPDLLFSGYGTLSL